MTGVMCFAVQVYIELLEGNATNDESFSSFSRFPRFPMSLSMMCDMPNVLVLVDIVTFVIPKLEDHVSLMKAPSQYRRQSEVLLGRSARWYCQKVESRIGNNIMHP